MPPGALTCTLAEPKCPPLRGSRVREKPACAPRPHARNDWCRCNSGRGVGELGWPGTWAGQVEESAGGRRIIYGEENHREGSRDAAGVVAAEVPEHRGATQ